MTKELLADLAGVFSRKILSFASQPDWESGPVTRDNGFACWIESGPSGLQARCRWIQEVNDRTGRLEVDLVNTSAQLSPDIAPLSFQLI